MTVPEPSWEPSLGPSGDVLPWLGGARVRIVLAGAASAGRLSVVEIQADAGYEAAGHTHDREDETFYVLEGSLTVWAGDARGRLGAGDRAFLPRGVPHGYRVDAGPARVLNACTPGGLDGFFRQVAARVERSGPADAARAVAALAVDYGITYGLA
jgi:quercetin dioxygenase-like cupin family protein